MTRQIINAYRDAYSGIPRSVWIISLALFVNRCGSMVLAFFTLYMTSQLGFTVFQAGCIFSVFGLGSIAGCYAGGKLTEKFGPVRLQIVGLIIAGPLYFFVPLFHTFTGLACAVFVLSFFTEGVRPANATAVAQFTPTELQTRAYGLRRMALNLGVSFGPAIGGFLTQIDYVWLFIVDGVTTVGAGVCLLAYFGFKEHGDVNKKETVADDPETNGTGSPLQDRHFLAFLGLLLLTAVVFFQFHATYPKYLEDHYGLSEPGIGLIFAVNTIVIVIFEMLLLNYVRRWQLLPLIGIGSFLTLLGFGVLPLSTTIVFCVFSMLILTLGEMLSMPLCSGFVAKRSTGKNQGMYMAWYAMTYSLAAVIAPLIGSAVYEIDRDIFWYVSLGGSVLILFAFIALGKAVPPMTSESKAVDKEDAVESSAE